MRSGQPWNKASRGSMAISFDFFSGSEDLSSEPAPGSNRSCRAEPMHPFFDRCMPLTVYRMPIPLPCYLFARFEPSNRQTSGEPPCPRAGTTNHGNASPSIGAPSRRPAGAALIQTFLGMGVRGKGRFTNKVRFLLFPRRNARLSRSGTEQRGVLPRRGIDSPRHRSARWPRKADAIFGCGSQPPF